jgi:phosphomannomutase
MEEVRARDPLARVLGYEANGGVLLGFAAAGPVGPLAPLMTRDFLLPIIAPLAAAVAQRLSLADLWAALPARFTATDRVQEVPTVATRALITNLVENPAARAAFFAQMGPEQKMDLTDGLRLHFANGDVVHVRPSGNAPECRCYAEAASAARAHALVAHVLRQVQDAVGA